MIDSSLITLAELLAAALAVAIAGQGAIFAFRSSRSTESGYVALRLRFPRDLDAAGVSDVLSALSGWRPPWWRRWLGTPHVVFETHANTMGVEHYVLVPGGWGPAFERLVAVHAEGVGVERFDVPDATVRFATSYRLTSGSRPLRSEPGGQSRTLLSAMQPLAGGERVVVQVIVAPSPPSPAPTVVKDNLLLGAAPGEVATAEKATALRHKLAHPQLLGVIRIGASSGHVDRQHHLVRRVEASLHLSNAPGARLNRRLFDRRAVRHLADRKVPVIEWPGVFNSEELVGLTGWPVGIGRMDGLTLAGCKPLPPSQALPHEGTIVGDGIEHGRLRPVAIDEQARQRHLLALGPTGVGKTTLLTNFFINDMEEKKMPGIVLIDAKGDLVDNALEHIPAEAAERVVVIDPSDNNPVGINPLRMTGVSDELAAEQLLSVLHAIWHASWGPRTDDVLRATLRTIVTDPDGNFGDVGPMLTEPTFRHRMTNRLTDPTTIGFWRWFEHLSDGEREQVIAPSLNRWRALMGRPSLRRTFGQPHPLFDMAAALDEGKIVLVRLSAGRLGEDAAGLFGAVLLNSIWNLIQARASQPVERRRPVMLTADEFQRYAHLPVALEEFLSQARSFKVGVTLACQHLAQLPTDLRATVLNNPRSRITFQTGHSDASTMAKELGQGLTAEDIQGLDAYEIVAQLYAAGRTQPACTLDTRPTPEPTSRPADTEARSRARWGADGEAVDAWLVERMKPNAADKGDRRPPGRKPRGSR